MCDSENYNGKIVEIDYQTGKVLNVTDVLLGHMNSIAYNHNDNYIYTTDTKINKIDSKTFKTIESFSLDFQPQAICFDPKSDASYICERVDDNVVKLYSFDYVNKTTKAIGTFNYQLDSITHTPFSRRNGSQNMACYNGNIWYLAAGDLSQTMLQINPKDASIIQAISMNQVSYIYKIVEAESVCFTADGDIFVYSKGNIESVTDNGYAVLSYFNLYGNKCTNNYTYAYSSAERWAHLQGEFDSICRDGSSAYPFTSLEECIGAIKLGAFEGVRLNSDATVKNNITSVEFPLYIRLDGYKLTIEASVLQFGTLNIDGTTSSSRTSALQVNNNIQFTAFIYEITHLSVNSDYTMTFMLGVLVADHVTGGSFDGGNKTGLFKANTVTGGTFNNFLTN